MPVLFIVIAALIVLGALFLLRDASSSSSQKASSGATEEVRGRVAALIEERLQGWEISPDPEASARLSLRDTAVDRRIEVNVEELAHQWEGLMNRSLPEEAQQLIQEFVERLLGGSNSEESDFDSETALHALALMLVRPDEVPEKGLSQPAGPLSAVLVMRNPQGPDLLGPSDLEALGLDAHSAFDRALKNHALDLEEGPSINLAAGSSSQALVLEIGSGDPLAGSLALTQQARELAKERLGSEPLFLVPAAGRFYALSTSGTALEALAKLLGKDPLMSEAVPAEVLTLQNPARAYSGN